MNARTITTVLLALTLVLSVMGLSQAQGPSPAAGTLGTAFTYQGMLRMSGSPVTGTCDFRFGLWDADTAGTLVGFLDVPAVPVERGVFTVRLDFGSGAFADGAARWLGIEVRHPAGTGSYTALSPRQPLTPAPYSIYAAAGPFWSLSGNDSTDPVTNFVGTTDMAALELKVNGHRALRLDPTGGDTPSITGGYEGNWLLGTVRGATISGGGSEGAVNGAADDYGVVAGGRSNLAGNRDDDATNAMFATVGGGEANTAQGAGSTVSGGHYNLADGPYASVGGGIGNRASGDAAAVGGGLKNEALGLYSTVPGGLENVAAGVYAFAAGHRAKANHDGSFVWADSTDVDFASDKPDVFYVRASSGVMFAGPPDVLFRLMPNPTSPNIIGGPNANTVPADIVGATIGGGGYSGGGNSVTDNYGVVGGGAGNVAGDSAGTTSDATYATVAGGLRNHSSRSAATVGGGAENQAAGLYATVAGGQTNRATGPYSTVGGGYENEASTERSTVAGGRGNQAVAYSATVGGGQGNVADATRATIAGGDTNSASGIYSFVGGGSTNSADSEYTVVGGGYRNTAGDSYGVVGGGYSNRAAAPSSTVAGGYQNVVSGTYGAVTGGQGNIASASYGAVGGGYQNTASATYSVIAGGYSNEASRSYSSVGGGLRNIAGGNYSAVPGGANNTAEGSYSFAAGRRAKAMNQGCFVWGDSTDADIGCYHVNTFMARASGGVYFYSNAGLSTGVYLAPGASSWSPIPAPSDRNLKAGIQPVDGTEVLERLAEMPISTWSYSEDPAAVRHMGPMAQDFALFGLGEDDTHIDPIDANGVALASMQGVYRLLQEKDAAIAAQQTQINDLQARLAALEKVVAELANAQKGGQQ